ncbi:MAG: hypothetical protein CSB16_01300 [Clostridiales bacterium]|nr:MAG: hypothetical protein CSB16_01300 [Clostridiales bacterium]
MREIYIIGGSPCSGKSTVASYLSERYDLEYFQVDDHLEKYTKKGALLGYPICESRVNIDNLWTRDPSLMCDEEIKFYEEIFDFILEDLENLESSKSIITEGAAFLPKLIDSKPCLKEKYMVIAPSSDFQVLHYRKREWVDFVLEKCADKEKSFSNWMRRDILFAEKVRKECIKYGYYHIVNNGNLSIKDLIHKVSVYFGLNI